MGVVVKGLKYVQKIDHVKGHLKYIGFRSNELATSQAREEYCIKDERRPVGNEARRMKFMCL